jgi:hypothetical protein
MHDLVCFAVGDDLEYKGSTTETFPAATITVLVRNCPRLEGLDILHELSGGSEDMLVDWFTTCTTLRALQCEVTGAEFTDRALIALAAHNPLLESVTIKAAPALLTDAGIAALVQFCPELCHISVAGGSSLTDDAIRAIAQHCPQLEDLQLPDSLGITEMALVHLLISCTALSNLRIQRACMTERIAKWLCKTLLQPRSVDITFVTVPPVSG